ncbi:hypothetical protein MMPV_001177 [Pyropia vietnamensis]
MGSAGTPFPIHLPQGGAHPLAPLRLHPSLVANLAAPPLGIPTLFTMQAAVAATLLAADRSGQSRDVLLCAPTGSGKTVAYALPLLQSLLPPPGDARGTKPSVPPSLPPPLPSRVVPGGWGGVGGGVHGTSGGANSSPTRAAPRALVVVPTRELVGQVTGVLAALAAGTGLAVGRAVGKTSLAAEARSLVEEGVDVLVATPGRLVDHLNLSSVVAATAVHAGAGGGGGGGGCLSLARLETLVLDESDRLLAQSFHGWVEAVLSAAGVGCGGETFAFGSPEASRGVMMADLAATLFTAATPDWASSVGCGGVGVPLSPLPSRRRYVRKVLVSATQTRNPARLTPLGLVRPVSFDTARAVWAAARAMRAASPPGRAATAAGAPVEATAAAGATTTADAAVDAATDGGDGGDEGGAGAPPLGPAPKFALPATLTQRVLIVDTPGEKPLALARLLRLVPPLPVVGRRSDRHPTAGVTPSAFDDSAVVPLKAGTTSLVFAKSVEAAHRLGRLLELLAADATASAAAAAKVATTAAGATSAVRGASAGVGAAVPAMSAAKKRRRRAKKRRTRISDDESSSGDSDGRRGSGGGDGDATRSDGGGAAAAPLEPPPHNPVRIVHMSSSLTPAQRAAALASLGAPPPPGTPPPTTVIVCSDVLARGLDLPALGAVVHYDVPPHGKTYVHRAGRTARGGEGGESVTILTGSQVRHFKALLRPLTAGAGPGAGAGADTGAGGGGAVRWVRLDGNTERWADVETPAVGVALAGLRLLLRRERGGLVDAGAPLGSFAAADVLRVVREQWAAAAAAADQDGSDCGDAGGWTKKPRLDGGDVGDDVAWAPDGSGRGGGGGSGRWDGGRHIRWNTEDDWAGDGDEEEALLGEDDGMAADGDDDNDGNAPPPVVDNLRSLLRAVIGRSLLDCPRGA